MKTFKDFLEHYKNGYLARICFYTYGGFDYTDPDAYESPEQMDDSPVIPKQPFWKIDANYWPTELLLQLVGQEVIINKKTEYSKGTTIAAYIKIYDEILPKKYNIFWKHKMPIGNIILNTTFRNIEEIKQKILQLSKQT